MITSEGTSQIRPSSPIITQNWPFICWDGFRDGRGSSSVCATFVPFTGVNIKHGKDAVAVFAGGLFVEHCRGVPDGGSPSWKGLLVGSEYRQL
jgi:hypothetical protein